MAVFKSKYRELSFYVDGELLSFSGGSFSTNDKKVIAVLETLKDVKRLDKAEEPGKDVKQKQKEVKQPKAEEPKKKDAKKKPSAK